jgi:hypothetical protein
MIESLILLASGTFLTISATAIRVFGNTHVSRGELTMAQYTGVVIVAFAIFYYWLGVTYGSR